MLSADCFRMPRRATELAQLAMPPKKKVKTVEKLPVPTVQSLDASFCDDEALPPGIVFTDVNQKKWRLGKPIGKCSKLYRNFPRKD